MYFSKDGKADGLEVELDPRMLSVFQKIFDDKITAQFPLRMVINKQKTKVLFAVDDDSFTDVLVSFLMLPLGTIVRVLKEHYGADNAPVFGSLGTLYEGVSNLDSAHFERNLSKHMLLNPRNSSDHLCQRMPLNIDDSPWLPHTTLDDFTRKINSVIISDDLSIVPQTEGLIQTLANQGITDIDGVELRDVTFGFNEIMDILKMSVLSHTSIFTKIVLNDKHTADSTTKSDLKPVFLSQCKIDQIEATPDSKKLGLRVMIRKSTNEFLCAEADIEFINFLLSFLTIPLGEVVLLLEDNSRLKSMDSLHSSLAKNFDFTNNPQPEIVDGIIKHKLAAGCLSEYQILPLSEETEFLNESIVKEMYKIKGNFVRGLKTYMVTDDLTVTPYCITNAISIINGKGIPLSDVKEVDMRIGLAEALSLLKASLTSTRALSNGLSLS